MARLLIAGGRFGEACFFPVGIATVEPGNGKTGLSVDGLLVGGDRQVIASPFFPSHAQIIEHLGIVRPQCRCAEMALDYLGKACFLAKRGGPTIFIAGAADCQAFEFSSDSTEHLIPIPERHLAGGGLAEKPHAGIPGTFFSLAEPAPVGSEGKQRPDRPVECARQMHVRIVDGDDKVQCCNLRREPIEIAKRVAVRPRVQRDAELPSALFDFVAAISVLQIDEGDAGDLKECCP